MKKRVLSLLLVLLMVMSLVPMSALAVRSSTDVAYAVEGGNIYFDKAWGIITECDKSVTKASIPSEIDGVAVTGIGGYAFTGCTRLTRIDIPNSVTSIGGYAFYGCKSLASIDIPNSVTSIGDEAFRGCTSLVSIDLPNSVTSIGKWAFRGCTSLASIDIPNSVTSIGNSAFYDCTSLVSVDIPNSVTSIGARAFYGCTSLAGIDIPSSVTSIGYEAFYRCTNLVNINVEQDNAAYSSEDGVLFNKNKTTLILYPIGRNADLYVIPNSVTSIVDYAFTGCTSLKSIDIPASVTNIDYDVFNGCTSLTSINVEQDNAAYSSEDGVLFDKEKTKLICYPIGSDRTEYRIPDGVKNVVYTAFRGGNYLKSITIPVSVERFCVNTFDDLDSLERLYYTGTVEQANAIVIYDSEATYVTYPISMIPADIHCADGIIHHYDDATVPPTCTTTGYTHHVCKYCNDSYDDDIKAELGHNFVDGKCKRCGVSESTVTPPHTHDYKAVVTKPTCTEQGYTTYTCSCGDSYKSDYKDALGHDYKNGTCTRCGAKDPNYKPQANFTDVAAGSYCYDAVQWAVANGITNGTDATHFSPNTGCTRGQVVTFLWRAAGEPTVGGNVGFVDVAPGSYCYEAVKWAVANGITKGTDAMHFSPNATCTRGQVVTFMYRAEGEPTVGGSNGFVDVAAGSYCCNAVQWAVANGITKGTDAAHFSPSATCTRGQVVTFLYRAE